MTLPSFKSTIATLPTISIQLFQTIWSPKRAYSKERRVFIAATLDSGSNINCIGRSLASEIGLVATQDGTTFKTSNGQQAKTRGSCVLGVFKDSRTKIMDLKFEIVDSLPVPCLLGLPFLNYGVLDLPDRKLTVKYHDRSYTFEIEDDLGDELIASIVKARKDLMIDKFRQEEQELAVKLFKMELPGGVAAEPVPDKVILDDYRKTLLVQGDQVLGRETNLLLEELAADATSDEAAVPDSTELNQVLDGLCPDDDAWKKLKVQTELSDSQQRRFERMIAKNARVFQTPKSPKDSLYIGVNARPLDVKLCTGQYSRPKRLPVIPCQLKKSWNAQLKKWKENGVVVAQEKAVPFLSPFVPVAKKDGTIRWTFDTRNLNRSIEFENVSLPSVDSVVEKMSRFKLVTALDFLSFYLSFPVTEATSDLLTFIDPTTSCNFKFIRSPFGLRGSASHSVQLTNELLVQLPFYNDRMCTYIDDVFIGSNDTNQLLDDLEQILDLIRPTNLRLKPSKCKIGQERSVIFGFEVCLGQFRIASDRTKALLDLPPPKTKRELLKLFGSFSYYRASLPFQSSLAYHQNEFHELLKKETPFVWNDSYQRKFENLKLALSCSVTRTAPRPDEKLNLRVDASKFYLGFVLSVSRPEGELIVTTGSRKWPPRFSKYDSCRLELLGCLTSLRMLRHMLLGHHVAVWTDNPYCYFVLRHRSKVLIEEPQIISRLLNEVSSIEFQIFKASNDDKEWAIVDQLSRSPHKWIISHRNIDQILSPTTNMDVTMLSSVDSFVPQEVSFATFSTEAALKDLRDFKTLVARIHSSEEFKSTGTVPQEFQQDIIVKTHALAHLGAPRLLAVLNHCNLHFANRRQLVADWIRSCVTCSTTKCSNRPLHVRDAVFNTSRPGEVTSFDINSIGQGQGATHVLVAVDIHTEFMMAYRLPPVPSAMNVLRSCMLHLVRFAPACHTVRVDNGAVFKSKLFQEALSDLDIKVSYASRFNSRSQSAVERKNKSLNMALRLMRSNPAGREFELDLASAALKINSIPHSRFKISPIELYFGTDIIGNQAHGFMNTEEAVRRTQNLQGLREVAALFRGHPIPNPEKYVEVGDLVRLATVQKVGANKISRLKFTESIFKVIEADHHRLTYKVVELDDDGGVKDADARPIVSHLRHLRLVQKAPDRVSRQVGKHQLQVETVGQPKITDDIDENSNTREEHPVVEAKVVQDEVREAQAVTGSGAIGDHGKVESDRQDTNVEGEGIDLQCESSSARVEAPRRSSRLKQKNQPKIQSSGIEVQTPGSSEVKQVPNNRKHGYNKKKKAKKKVENQNRLADNGIARTEGQDGSGEDDGLPASKARPMRTSKKKKSGRRPKTHEQKIAKCSLCLNVVHCHRSCALSNDGPVCVAESQATNDCGAGNDSDIKNGHSFDDVEAKATQAGGNSLQGADSPAVCDGDSGRISHTNNLGKNLGQIGEQGRGPPRMDQPEVSAPKRDSRLRQKNLHEACNGLPGMTTDKHNGNNADACEVKSDSGKKRSSSRNKRPNRQHRQNQK